MNHLLSVAQGWASFAVKSVVVLWLVMARNAYGKALSFVTSHTTLQERTLLKRLGTEAVHFAEAEFSHLPIAGQIERAVRYVTSAALALGIRTNESQIRAVVAWGMREMGMTSTQADRAGGGAKETIPTTTSTAPTTAIPSNRVDEAQAQGATVERGM